MSEKNNIESDALITEVLNGYAEEALLIYKESNKQARKRNRLAKRQYRQSVLNYEQAERQYLIEKSSLQPTFRLSVTEFLTCKPDFLNDPEQASEAKYLSDLGVGVDERVLRLRVRVKGEAEYMRPSLVIEKSKKGVPDERAHSMSQLLYFVSAASIEINENTHSFPVYLVYRDKTTLPVIHKYQVSQQADSALRRWDVKHLDTVYATSHKNLSALNSSSGCAALFIDREDG